MMTLPEKEWYRPDEVAKHYDVSLSAIYQWIQEGKLNAEKICGKTIRIPRQSIEEMKKPVME